MPITPTLARLFLREAENRMAAIRGAADDDNGPGYEVIAREAHGLKGASQHVPAARFTDGADRLEQAALAGEEQEVRAAIEDLVRQWESLRDQVNRLTGNDTD